MEAVKNCDRRPYAVDADYEVCRELHRRHGTTYYWATQLFPVSVRKKTHALYGFVRVPDEWVDNPDGSTLEARQRLSEYRDEMICGLQGKIPSNQVLRAFCDVMLERQIPVKEPLRFLQSMEQDLDVTRYETFKDLRGYMRGSAGSVGVMMCYLFSEKIDPKCLPFAVALGEAMQLTNFLRDIGEDAARSRIYLPLEHLRQFEVTEESILEGENTDAFKRLMKFEIARTRELYEYSKLGVNFLPPRARKAVRLAAALYSRILDRIEGCDYDVFRTRARTSGIEKLVVAGGVLAGLPGYG